MTETVLLGVLTIALGFAGYVVKEIRDMKKKIETMISRKDAEGMVDFHAHMQTEIQKQVNRGFSEDVKRIEGKLDKLIDKLL